MFSAAGPCIWRAPISTITPRASSASLPILSTCYVHVTVTKAQRLSGFICGCSNADGSKNGLQVRTRPKGPRGHTLYTQQTTSELHTCFVEPYWLACPLQQWPSACTHAAATTAT